MELSMKHRRKEPQNLHELGVGQCGIVTEIRSTGAMKRRLVDMGITPGADIVMNKKAPLGDPIEVTIRGYELTLRKAEAAYVTMEVTVK